MSFRITGSRPFIYVPIFIIYRLLIVCFNSTNYVLLCDLTLVCGMLTAVLVAMTRAVERRYRWLSSFSCVTALVSVVNVYGMNWSTATTTTTLSRLLLVIAMQHSTKVSKDVYIPPLTGKLEQKLLTIWSGVLTSISSSQCSAINGRSLPEQTDFGPAVCS